MPAGGPTHPSYPSINRGIGARHGEVRRAHQMLNAALKLAQDIPERNLSTFKVIVVSRSYDKLKIII